MYYAHDHTLTRDSHFAGIVNWIFILYTCRGKQYSNLLLLLTSGLRMFVSMRKTIYWILTGNLLLLSNTL